MTLAVLQDRVAAAVASASSQADACKVLLARTGLQDAIGHCVQQGVEPPQCSLTAQSDNARRLREAAARKLSDSSWWAKSMETVVIRRYEAEQSAAGNVTNYVSDGLFAYMQSRKAKK